jgi:hypothetical protein
MLWRCRLRRKHHFRQTGASRTAERERSFSNSTEKRQHAALKDRPVYGNPSHFRGLGHEPVNEQGVVLLFGMLAKDLGYAIEAVQTGFPDCEAMRRIGPERWQRVNIEFEFESKSFHQHGHPSNGCDVIVCWRHNWQECPKHIEVVEFSSVVKSLAKSGECAEIVPQPIGVAIAQKRFDFLVGLSPDRDSTRQRLPSLIRQRHQTTAPVRRVCRDPDQAATPQRLEGGRQRGPIHREECGYCGHAWWLRTVQRHQ